MEKEVWQTDKMLQLPPENVQERVMGRGWLSEVGVFQRLTLRTRAQTAFPTLFLISPPLQLTGSQRAGATSVF